MLYKLEALRGISACVIILVHSPFLFGAEESQLLANCDLLPDLFFILSGIVMSLAYQDKINKGLKFKNYFILRLGRIYPLHLITLLSFFLLIIVSHYAHQSGVLSRSLLTENQTLLSGLSNLLLYPLHWLTRSTKLELPKLEYKCRIPYLSIILLLCKVFSEKLKYYKATQYLSRLIHFSLLTEPPHYC